MEWFAWTTAALVIAIVFGYTAYRKRRARE
jgi:hypothetical protein